MSNVSIFSMPAGIIYYPWCHVGDRFAKGKFWRRGLGSRDLCYHDNRSTLQWQAARRQRVWSRTSFVRSARSAALRDRMSRRLWLRSWWASRQFVWHATRLASSMQIQPDFHSSLFSQRIKALMWKPWLKPDYTCSKYVRRSCWWQIINRLRTCTSHGIVRYMLPVEVFPTRIEVFHRQKYAWLYVTCFCNRIKVFDR